MYTPGPATNVSTSVEAFKQKEHEVVGSAVIIGWISSRQASPYNVRVDLTP